MEFDIKHHKKLTRSGAMPLVCISQAEIMRAGHGDHNLNIDYDDEILCAYEKQTGEIIGFITFMDNDCRYSIFVRLGFVSEPYRRQGVHTALYNKLKEIAAERDVKLIETGIHIDNIKMQKHVEKQGRRKFAILYVDDISIPEKTL